MSELETKTVFAGVDGRTDTQLPEWYAEQTAVEDTEVVPFADAIRSLPRATETRVAYYNPYHDEWVQTERFNALVEPTRLEQSGTTAGGGRSELDRDKRGDGTGSSGSEDSVDALFHIPTRSYAVINPADVYAPFEAVLRETTVDGRPLGEVVFGEIRQYRGGGEVHMDVMFDGLSVDLPDRHDPITMGLTSGYDYFGGHAVYMEGFARDTTCANSLRSLTDRETVKHVGEVTEFGPWWEQILEQLEFVANDLYDFITDAQDITVDFTQTPFDIEEFYTLLGFPDYLTQRAASDARANAPTPFEVDMWTLHSGATYALTHFFTGKEGSALDSYVRTANDLLFNPEASISTVEQAYERAAETETGDTGQTGLESQLALAQIERVGEDVRQKATQFEERESALRERFTSPPSQ